MSVESAAATILQRGVELDTKQRYTEALVCYQEGIQILVDSMKNCTGNKKTYLRSKIEEYMNRAEQIKEKVTKLKEDGKFHEQISIENNSTGHSYQSVFGRFLDADVTSVKIEDPYVRSFHQCQNFVRFCELLVKNCKNLKIISLQTTKENNNNDQIKWFRELETDLRKHSISLNIEFSTTLHDREITLSTGWIVKIGRGLDYFKAPENKFSLGIYDLDFRNCHETTIDIFHSKNTRQTT